MKSLGTTARSRAKWMGLAAVCAMVATLAPAAHAQGGAKLGAVLGVPVPSLGSIIAANAIKNNVSVLHISQNAFGGQNSQIATIDIRQRDRAGSSSSADPVSCKIPWIWLPQIQGINLNRLVVNESSVGNNDTQVADVQVAQSNLRYWPDNRYLLVPDNLVGRLLQLNSHLGLITQVAVGDGNAQVAVLQVEVLKMNVLRQVRGGGIVLAPLYAVNPLLQINGNVKDISPPVLGNETRQVATLYVDRFDGQ
jgi:hypothetical protein